MTSRSRPSAQAGGEHSLFQNSKGHLFSTGACGLGWSRLSDVDPSSLAHWRRVPLPEPCASFFPSYYHNLAIGQETQKLYTWGCGTFVEGGLEGVVPALGPHAHTDVGDPPQHVALDTSPKGQHVKQVAGGAYHSIALTKDGTVYTFGAGQLGQLGRPMAKAQNDKSGLPVDPVPRPIALPTPDKGDTPTSISSGFYNTLVIGTSGSLYCCGENQNKQCGTQNGIKNLTSLAKVTELAKDKVKNAQGGYCHTLIQTVAGKVLSMGCGEEGQRGDGRDMDTADRPVVSEVKLPSPATKALQIAAGANHSVVLGSDGNAYTFGANDVGQCGPTAPYNGKSDLDDDEGDDSGNILAPTKIRLPPGVGKVVEVSAGYAHTLVQTESGRVFAFGESENGQLGPPSASKQDFEVDMSSAL